MGFELTEKARVAADTVGKQIQIVLQIDGVTEVYSAVDLKKYIRIGDKGLKIDGTWLIGGTRLHEDSSPYLTFERGTTTSITQQLDQFSGRGSTISAMSVNLIDKNKEISKLISPGEVVTDVLGRKAKIWIGFDSTGWPDDYMVAFRGVIDDISAGAGFVTIRVSHPDQKKRSALFPKVDAELSTGIDADDTTITISTTAGLVQSFAGAGAEVDDDFLSYVRIDDELIAYLIADSGELQNCVRGQLGTSAASHDQGAEVTSFYRLKGNVIDLALKLMLSSPEATDATFATDVPITSFERVDGVGLVENAIFFRGINVEQEYGLVVGCFVQVTGATNSENVGGTVIDVVVIPGGSYVVVTPSAGGSYVEETDSPAKATFSSPISYISIPVGLGLSPDEVDIAEHLRIRDNFLSSFEVDCYIKDTIDAKEFIEKELYLPAGCFSIPRKARASVGYHIGPIPGTKVKTLSAENVLNAKDLKVRRTITKNFYNTIVYKYELLALDDKFTRGVITTNTDSTARIPVGNKALTIESVGLREDLNAENLISTANDRRLNKYKFGAEFIEGVKINFKTGIDLEIGDIVLLDMESLQLTDSKSGTRAGKPRLFEIDNRKLDLRTGQVTLNIVDTNFDLDARYGLISPASKIKAGISTKKFIIKKTGNSPFGKNEFRKWEDLTEAAVIIRSSDYSTSGTSTIESVIGNEITLATDLEFTPAADYLMELDVYTNQPDKIKLVYTFMSDGSNDFADGGSPYGMI